jgi:predicted nucleic acid-binding protein
MRKVFADTLFWIAATKPRDEWHGAAMNAKKKLAEAIIVTTDDVLVEFLASLSQAPFLRDKAVQAVRAIFRNPNVQVMPHTRKSFLDGLDRYAKRRDKSYTLTDCISMNVMEAESIQQVLTNDHHFEQEGFVVLIKKS